MSRSRAFPGGGCDGGGSRFPALYPLYEVRKGDLWYQLETALREVCVTIPEATVPEFERKVNELMLVSLSLTTSRRRAARPAGRPVKGSWARA